MVFEAGMAACEGEVGGSRAAREKRAPFSSWAGKRSSEEDLTSAEMEQVLPPQVHVNLRCMMLTSQFPHGIVKIFELMSSFTLRPI